MLSPNQKSSLTLKADRLFFLILWMLLLVSLALASRDDTWFLALAVGLPLAVIPSLFIWLQPGQFITRCVVAIALMLFCALNIHQARGMAELHFGIFVLLAFLLCYQDWRVIVVAAAVAAIHHLSFNFLQELGFNTICFASPSLELVLIHAAYVVAEAAVLIYLAVVLSRETHRAEASNHDLQGLLTTAHHVSQQVKVDVEALTNASGEIAGSSAGLSTQVTAQAAALDSVTASMDKLRSTAFTTASSLHQADDLINSASDLARLGGSSVHELVASIVKIDASSRSIVNIVDVMNTFAFQMKLLSLNASVEAANAGVHGKGFSIVAAEVRSLAQHCEAAAADIRQLAENTVKELEAGGALADKAGHDMTALTSAIEKVTVLAADIAKAGQAQSEEISKVTEEVSRLNTVTQTTERLVQGMAQAAKGLYSYAGRVSHTVAQLGNTAEPKPEPSLSPAAMPARRRPEKRRPVFATPAKHLVVAKT